jgi:hypothetical protein
MIRDGTLALLCIGAAALCDQGVYHITRASLEAQAIAKPALTYTTAVAELKECKKSMADMASLLPGVFPGSCRAYRVFVADYETAHQVLDAGDAKPF